MYTAWYTKNLKNDTPIGKIHYSEFGEETYCGKEISGPRWFLETIIGIKVNCKECLSRVEQINYLKDNYKNPELPEWYQIILKPLREFECFDEKMFIESGGYEAYSQLWNITVAVAKLEKSRNDKNSIL